MTISSHSAASIANALSTITGTGVTAKTASPTGSPTGNAASGNSSSSASSTALSETQFLQLLSEQLQNQDPLQPQTNTEFLAQMAQFTALQETDTLNQQVSNLTANTYIGSTVQLSTTAGAVTGTVSAIDTSGNSPNLVVNGQEYPLSSLQYVQPATSSAGSSTPTASSTSSTAKSQ